MKLLDLALVLLLGVLMGMVMFIVGMGFGEKQVMFQCQYSNVYTRGGITIICAEKKQLEPSARVYKM